MFIAPLDVTFALHIKLKMFNSSIENEAMTVEDFKTAILHSVHSKGYFEQRYLLE